MENSVAQVWELAEIERWEVCGELLSGSSLTLSSSSFPHLGVVFGSHA